MSRDINQRASFDIVRYSNCWEDTGILCEALQPKPGKRVLAIASGGDNSFGLLAAGAEVVAADLSTAQLACVELKREAILKLDHDEVLAFTGIRDSDRRIERYRELAPGLSGPSREFWDRNMESVSSGIIHCGKFENFFRLFRTRILPLVHSRRTINELMKEKDRAARNAFFKERWNNLRWRLLFRIFMSRFVMGRLGRDPEFFRYVEGSVSDRILERTRYALVELPNHRNPYLDYILNGNFTVTLPYYLEPARFEALRAGLGGLTLFHGSIQDAVEKHGQGGFDGFNLSDIFEYLDEGLCGDIYGRLLGSARQGARLAYWNMLVPRSCPAEFADQVTFMEELSKTLFSRDLAFFYSAFVVEEVRA